MNEGIALCVEVDPTRIERRLDTRYLDRATEDIDEAIAVGRGRARGAGHALSVGLLGNAAEVLPALLDRGFAADVVTDQTSAHDLLDGYVPAGMSYDDALRAAQGRPRHLREAQPRVDRGARRGVARVPEERIDLRRVRQQHPRPGSDGRGRRTRSTSPVSSRHTCGRCSARARGRSAGWRCPAIPPTSQRTDEAILELFPDDERLHRWIAMASKRVAFQGLPARICWLGYGERAKAGLRFNELVAAGEVGAPIVIGRDHLDAGSVASPYRETEGMIDGSDAIADWPILNALLNTAAGAHWVSVHHGGGVGIGYSIHAGMVVVADGTEEAAARLERVLTTDPGTGVMRHADAGYGRAYRCRA